MRCGHRCVCAHVCGVWQDLPGVGRIFKTKLFGTSFMVLAPVISFFIRHYSRSCIWGMTPAYSLGSEAHAQAGQVAIAEREEDHENDVPGVMSEHNGQVMPVFHVTQNEEGDEDDPSPHQHRQPDAVFTRLRKQSTRPVLTPRRHCAHTGYMYGIFQPVSWHWWALCYTQSWTNIPTPPPTSLCQCDPRPSVSPAISCSSICKTNTFTL